MIEGKSVLAIITARGGSKGLPGKNIIQLAGKPLLSYSIKAAQKSKYIDRLILSSDDEDIIKVALDYGCEVPFVRPANLAMDDTPGIKPILHAIESLESRYDYVMLLQPTSPLRIAEDIDNALEKCVSGYPACVSVTAPDKSPYWMFTLTEAGTMKPLLESKATRRQDLPEVYALNGAVYAAETTFLIENKTFVTAETAAYIMPKTRSVDIDEMLDIKLCEVILSQMNE
jgi:CMP-N,N'-diacetyllegionaminic acid synthase